MLQITIPRGEYFDDLKQEFIEQKEQTLSLEHSLISISKWEMKWQVPFLDKLEKGLTNEEFIDYVRCMSLNSNIKYEDCTGLTKQNADEIAAYIDNKMTATWFNEQNKPKGSGRHRGQVVTSELIYYWMIQYEIPIEECQKWHLNRLLTLIHVCEAKSSPSKKMKKKDIYASNRALNEARRKKLGTKG